MANKRVPEFTQETTIAIGDKLYFVKVADTSEHASGSSRHIDYGDLIAGLIQNGANIGTTGAGVFHGKNGADLQFKTLVEGSNIVLTVDETNKTIEIRSTAAGGGDAPVDHTFDNNADFNAAGASFTSGLVNPVVNDKLEIKLDNGQFRDNFTDTSGIDGAESSNIQVADGRVTMSKVIDPGTGADGSVVINSNKNISTDTLASGRTIADGVAYNVSQLTSTTATLTESPVEGALGQGDEMLLISMQGYSGQTDNVGNYEFLKIASIADNIITFTTPKSKVYGDGSGDLNLGTTDGSKHKVVLVRVPNYSNVTIAEGVTLTCNRWDGEKWGILCFRCSETLSISGIISADYKGYRIVPANNVVMAGESLIPAINRGQGDDGSPNFGGGGAQYHSYGAAGAGHFEVGQGPARVGNAGTPGDVVGDEDLAQIFMGSAGGNNQINSLSGSGGGIILIAANVMLINSSASLSSIGTDASTNGDYICNGGCAAGSIFCITNSLSLFITSIGLGRSSRADNGASGAGYGGSGRGKFLYQTLTDGSLISASNVTNTEVHGTYLSDAILQSPNIVSGKIVDFAEEFSISVTALPGGSALTVQFSQDTTDWYNSAGSLGGTDSLSAGANTIDLSGLLWSGDDFYYRIAYTGTGSATPEIDSVTLNYSPDGFTSGPQTWISPKIGSSNTSGLPLELKVAWTDDGDAPKPKFQLQGSDSPLFAGEQDVFPAAGQYYQDGTAYDINNNVALSLGSEVFTPRKYWRLLTILDSGPIVTTAPTVDFLNLKVKLTSNINTSPSEKLFAFRNFY